METKKESPGKGIVKALADFQQAVPAITKEKKAGQGNFSYKYGSLAHIFQVITPHMKKAGLVITQPINYDDGKHYICTTLYHVGTGESIESKMELPQVEFKGMNIVQSGGAVITYVRRYSLMSLMGLVTEEDDKDAQGEVKKPAQAYQGTGSRVDPGSAPAKKWLNPSKDGQPTDVWLSAVKFLADGGTIEQIKQKYKIARPNEEKLMNESLEYSAEPEGNDLPFDDEQADDIGPGQSNTNFDNEGPVP